MRDKLLKTILPSSGLVAVVAAEGSTIVAGSELQDFISEATEEVIAQMKYLAFGLCFVPKEQIETQTENKRHTEMYRNKRETESGRYTDR